MPGSGKSTVAKLLAKSLNAERIYVGALRRELARKKGMTLRELNIYALTHPETDVDIDKQVAAEARAFDKKGKIVLVEGRTQFHFLPESVKIYLKVALDEAARRILKDMQQEAKKKERNEGNLTTLSQVKKEIAQREENDAQRFRKYYGFDHRDEKHYDAVIDTTKMTPEEVVEKIMKFLEKLAGYSRAK